MHLAGTGKKPWYVHYLLSTHLALRFPNQDTKFCMMPVHAYALVLLYTMQSEAEAFYCLESFVERCRGYAAFDGGAVSLVEDRCSKVWCAFLFPSSRPRGLIMLYGSP
jgi:hypothetical protein